MSGPQRIQRRRTKGWRMPEGAVYVGRPSPYGNPFPAAQYGAEQAVRLYREGLLSLDRFALRNRIRRELRGRDLACWCPLDQPCHADVLLEVANS